jgi:hypothetical protein
LIPLGGFTKEDWKQVGKGLLIGAGLAVVGGAVLKFFGLM